jgi:sortase A
MKKNNAIKNNNIWGLHIAIPVLLIISGFCLIIIAAYTIAKPYLSLSKLFVDTNNKSSTIVASSKLDISAANRNIIYSGFGQLMGHLIIKNAGIDANVYHGDHDEQLKKGIGHFVGSSYPGEGGKIILDAHRETFFKNLKNVKLGDIVLFKTSYGEYQYEVYNIKIIKAADSSILLPNDSNEYIIMYTCYPFDTIGYKPDRYLVYAKLVKGPK